MRQTTEVKNAKIREIAGRLVARDTSRHYWIFESSKWVRYGLRSIAAMLHLGAKIISAMLRMVDNTKQTAKHLSVSELAVYAVLFIVQLLLLVVFGLKVNTLAQFVLIAPVPMTVMAGCGIFAYSAMVRQEA